MNPKVDDPQTPDRKQIILRVQPSLHTDFSQAASNHGRSINVEAEMALQFWIKLQTYMLEYGISPEEAAQRLRQMPVSA